MSFIETLFLTRKRDSNTINKDLSVCKREGRRYREKNREKKQMRTTKKKQKRAFSSWCLHCYLRLHQVKSSSSLCFCVNVARKQCEGSLITFALCSAHLGWAMCACCPTGSRAWASDQVGPARSSLAQPMLVGLDLAQKKKKRVVHVWALGSAGPNYIY